MKKVIIFLICLIPFNSYAVSLPTLSSDKILIYDLTSDKSLVELNSDEITSIASLTKIMTTITALENITDLNETVTITQSMLNGIYWNASVAGLKVGDKVTYLDLLYASMLPSGADATQALAYTISGSVANFVEEMNDLADKIGMTDTNFVNTTGLDAKNHFSTASDVLKLLKYALNNQTFKRIFTTKEYVLTNGLEVSSTLEKFNQKMELDITRILGSKTGFTDAAGYCLASLFNSNNHEIVMITLGAKKINNMYYHIVDSVNLIPYIDEKLIAQIMIQNTQDISLILTNDEVNKPIEYDLNKKIMVVAFASCVVVVNLIVNVNQKNKKGSKE